MPLESTTESHQPTTSAIERPHSRKGVWVRIVVYLVLASGLGLAVWQIYQNHQKAAASSAKQAAATELVRKLMRQSPAYHSP